MAIRIFEMNGLPDGRVPVRRVPFSVSQEHATIDATSRQSSTFAAATRIVTIQADNACHVVFGENPTATTAGYKLEADRDYDFGVTPGHRVAWVAG